MNEFLKEEWKPLTVEGCEFRYEISTYGRVKDIIGDKMVAPVLTGKPQYFYVNLQPIAENGIKSKRILRRVHNLVGQVFIQKEDDNYTIVDHIDRNKYNNSLDNLRWVCRKGNSRNLERNVKMKDGTLVRDLCEKSGLPFSVFSYMFYGDCSGKSEDEVYDIAYNNYFLMFRGKRCVRKEVEDLLGLERKNLTYFLDKGMSYEEIQDSGYKYPLEFKDYNYSVECFGKWFPYKKDACAYYGFSVGTVQDRERQGETLEEALTPRERKDTRIRLTYRGEEHTFDSLAEISGHPKELIVDRISNKGWSVDKAVETPLQRVKFYYLNGERMTKKAMLERLGIINTKAFNSAHNKSKLSIEELLEQKYNINLTGIKISTTP